MGRIRLFSSASGCSVLKMIVTLSWFLSSISSHASETLVSNLHQIVINNYSSVNAFYNLGVNIGDRELEGEIENALASSEKALANIKSETAEQDYRAEIDKFEQEYTAFRDLLATNVQYMTKRGYPDLRLSDDLTRLNTEFAKHVSSFKEKVLATSDATINKEAETCRTVTQILAQLVTKYSARSTSNVSQVFQGEETGQLVENTIKIVDDKLAELRNSANIGPEGQKLLKSTATKWKFIRGSFLNYNENNVNYVVNLYAKKMIAAMTEVESLILDQRSE